MRGYNERRNKNESLSDHLPWGCSMNISTLDTIKEKLTGSDNHKSFNFDLERMKEALAAPSHIMPSNLTFKEFQEWMKSKTTKN